MFDTTKNENNEEHLIFLDPVRFRFNYMVKYIHENREKFARVVDAEEQNFKDLEEMRKTDSPRHQ